MCNSSLSVVESERPLFEGEEEMGQSAAAGPDELGVGYLPLASFPDTTKGARHTQATSSEVFARARLLVANGLVHTEHGRAGAVRLNCLQASGIRSRRKRF
jgi:hypothetical protein